jgi:penicillin-binding protein 1B
MKRPHSRHIARLAGLGGVAVLLTSAFFLHRGQQRLLDLVNHRDQNATEVYSTWLDLDPKSGRLTRDQVRAMLDVLGYEHTEGTLARIGQYREDGGDLEVWTRGFEFPEETLAPQALKLTFWLGKLSNLETLPDNHSVPLWRLEPKRLARWSARGGAAQPKVHIEELPPYVPQAVIAIEDKRFFQHGAIDLRGLARAVWIDMRRGELRQGGSTISQQLSRSIFLSVKRSFTRKLLEAALAFYLEARYTKPQLLEMYLNQVYWGQDGGESLLGLEATSRSFFGKNAKNLALPEAALLAGLLQSPNHYSPRADLRIAQQRRNLVLALMKNQSFISEEQFADAVKQPIRLAPATARAGEAPYFVSTLQESLAQQYSLGVLMTQGWRIFSTLDPVLQAFATTSLRPPVGQAAMVAVEPASGAVRAWVGGTDYGRSTYDRVIYARRQPGSAFKPIVMLAAIDSRKATQATLLEDKPFTVKTPQGPWTPQNYDHKYRGQASLWDALVLSLNVPTAHLAILTGLDTIADYARRLGIQSPVRAVPSLALGTSEVNVLELTGAYATLANRGTRNTPYTIETIIDSEKNRIETHIPDSVQAVPDTSAYLVTQMLQDVFVSGTAHQAKDLGFTYPAAGKTGTAENYQDAWFIGYTPALACGVWVGYDQPRPLGHAAAGIALPIWTRFMQRALAQVADLKWEEPRGIEWKTIDPDSGQEARSGCVHRRKEGFLAGTSPDKMCTLHPGGLRGFFYRLTNK